MRFCPDCESRLVQNIEDVAGPKVCPKCNPDKVRARVPEYGANRSGKTKPCAKGCGAEIYWDPMVKSESGKFIPIDAETNEPHSCSGAAQPEPAAEEGGVGERDEERKDRVALPDEILYDISKIPRLLAEGDGIFREIIKGHEEGSLAIIHYEKLTAPEAKKVPLKNMNKVLSPEISGGLKKYGFDGLLQFQAEASKAVIGGKNVIISAPTGSGKTEAFAIPVLQKMSEDWSPGVFTLLIYPLNALIDDQVAKISKLIEMCGLGDKIAAYSVHGGQSYDYKEAVIAETEKRSLIIATNFDFINFHLILQDKKWTALFRDAKILVMDEAHSYTSFHGSNVYHVLRRMRKYMGDVQFVGSSATLDNSKEFFSSMFDLPARSLAYVKSTSRRKQDMHVFFVMPIKYRQRTTMEALSSICYRNGTAQLVFSNSHNDAEFLASNIADRNRQIRIQVHRGGLDQRDRKLYESQMKEGELDVLSCTPTLELGIDIGHVDVVISAFKNEFDSFVQRIGRAGRMGQRAYAICVFDPDDATCHYFARHIDEYLGQSHIIEINKKNPMIAERHAESAKVEGMAAAENDKSKFFDFAGSVNLRGASGEIAIYHNSRKIGTRAVPVGYYQLHQKAIYHFNRQNYEVKSLTKSGNGARAYLVRSTERNKRTMPIVRTDITQIEGSTRTETRNIRAKKAALSLRYGMISLDRTITGYMKGDYNKSADEFTVHNGKSTRGWKNFRWGSSHSAVSIILPPETTFGEPSGARGQIGDTPQIHTVAHILINAGKILTKSETGDIDVLYEDGIIHIYDNSSDGFNGCSKMIYDGFEEVLQTGFALLEDCDCSAKGTKAGEVWGGCPKCTFTTNYCQTKNKGLSKEGAKKFFSLFVRKKGRRAKAA